MLKKLGMEEGEAIEHPWVTKAIENAQRKVEGHNFDIRKHLLEYDDVANEQRKVVYKMRNDSMKVEDLSESIDDMRADSVAAVVNQYIPVGTMEESWDIEGAVAALSESMNEDLPIQKWLDEDSSIDNESLQVKILDRLNKAYRNKEELAGDETLRRFEKFVILKTLDDYWKDHLASMDYLRQSVGLRGYAQKNPKQEYKRESFELFSLMLDEYRAEVVSVLAKVQVRDAEETETQQQSEPPVEVTYQHANAASPLNAPATSETDEELHDENGVPFVRDGKKIGRNEPCWCGSGKKFKQCHGKLV